MATDWMGGDPNEPNYYISVRYSEVEKSFLKRMFSREKTFTEKTVSVITSSRYYSLSKKEKDSYRGMTIEDVYKHGTDELRKKLPDAEARVLGRLIGMPF